VVNYNVEKSPFILFPDNRIKVVWDLIGMVFIIYQGILVPFRICFEAQAFGALGVFELIQDFYFLLDIILTANTGYYHKGNLILLRTLIILNYLKLWFWLDLAASFPYSMLVNLDEYFNLDEELNSSITTKAPQILRILKFMRFMRFLRLIRVLKLKKILVRVNKNFNF
jgi:hypothetical protein